MVIKVRIQGGKALLVWEGVHDGETGSCCMFV